MVLQQRKYERLDDIESPIQNPSINNQYTIKSSNFKTDLLISKSNKSENKNCFNYKFIFFCLFVIFLIVYCFFRFE